MKQTPYNDEQLKELKQILVTQLCTQAEPTLGKDDRESQIYRTFALSTDSGKQVYGAFTDEALLLYLKQFAEERNHAPSQKEIFWVMRDYIKQRFQKWPYALKAAGLSASAGKGGTSMETVLEKETRRQQLLASVREKAVELGKIPHPKDMPEVREALKPYYDNWGSVIAAAEIDEKLLKDTVFDIDDLEEEYLVILQEIKAYAYAIGRSPIHGEIDAGKKAALIERCGSWRNALYQIGLEPVQRIKPFCGNYIDYRREDNQQRHSDRLHDCFYKVLNLSQGDLKDLQTIAEIRKTLGRIPTKKDVPRELRLRLQAVCGTWTNVLYQIGIEPKTYHAAMRALKRQPGK